MDIAYRTFSGDPLSNTLDPSRPVFGFRRDIDRPNHIARHQHRRAQLVYASRGVMTVITAQGTWVVPPQQAVWVPARVPHEISASGALSLRSLYIDPAFTARLLAQCCVVAVRPLLRELILELVDLPPDYVTDGPHARIAAVLLDELRRLQPVPLHLPAPNDRRLCAIAQALTADPADPRTLTQWAQQTGASARTLARRFSDETGMSFSEWRTRLRVLSAIERLALGQPVTTVAYDLGYRSPSAFIARFRQTVGASPTQYLRS